MLTEDIPHIGRGNIVRTQVNAIRSNRQGNIGSGVNEQSGGRWRIFAYSADCFASKQFQFAGRQIFLAKLDEIHPAAGGFGDFL